MTAIKTLVAGAVAALLFAADAHAADPAGTWPVFEKPAPRYQELLSGWYLRMDAGYRLNSATVTDTTPIRSVKADTSISGTFGFGYKYQWFRADVTFDGSTPWYVKANTATPLIQQPEFMAKISWRDVMVNGYVDLGTWGGFTPYIGAGGGVVELKGQEFVDGTQVGDRAKSSNAAWAAMAGVSYQFAPQWVVDVGYRYTSFGSLQKADGGGATATAPHYNNITAQEVRVGVRFLFD